MRQNNNAQQKYTQGEKIFAKSTKVSSELLTLTYGAFISKLIKDNQHRPIEEVNEKLDKMGYNIGTRIIDEFFSKSPPNRGLCSSFRETVEVIAKDGFKMFLGVTCDVVAVPHAQLTDPNSNPELGQREFTLILKENPLADFVILPPQYQQDGPQSNLWYSNLICGVIRGALDMVNMKVNCYFVRDVLNGDAQTEIRLELKEIVKDKYEDDSD